MCSQETYTIDLKGLTEDVTVRDFSLDDGFFRALDGSQLEHGALHVSVSIRKMAGFFDLQFRTVGSVTISCDRCLDDMEHYEFVMLAIPIKHVHAPGKCNSAMTQKLDELSGAVRSSEEDGGDGESPSAGIDPRWEALSKLKIED